MTDVLYLNQEVPDDSSCSWLDHTNRSVILTEVDPWNHPLLEEFPKRVSLGSTETWMTEESDHEITFMEGLESDPVLSGALPDELWSPMSVDDELPNMDHSDVDQWQERRAQLAASMQASKQTRELLKEHVRTRANLKQVLADIEKSSAAIRTGLLEETDKEQTPSSQ